VNPVDWLAANLRIIDKGGSLVPLVPNQQQIQLYAYLARQQAAGQPGRAIVLKARRMGVSTAVGGLFFALTNLNPNRSAFICAHDDTSSADLFQMTRRFQQELPAGLQRETEYSNRREIVYRSPWRSQVQVQTAGTSTLKRGALVHFLHCSEVAWWRDAGATLLSVLQTVPDRTETLIILESTANGASGEFYDRWNAAVAYRQANPTRFDGYLPVFFSWLQFPEYALALEVGEDLGYLDDDERGLVALGAAPEQLKWRRQVIRDKCGGDDELFKQEYPSTPDEAFRVSGRPAIPAAIVARHEATSRDPIRRVVLRREGGAVKAYDVGSDVQYYWQVWQGPQENTDYVVGGDVSEGRLADPANPRSEPDASAAVVIDRRQLVTVATWHGRIEPDWFGEEMLKAAQWYNQAWASPEANSAGMAALAAFTRAGYGRLYQRQRSLDTTTADDSPMWGWKTTVGNRDYMIDSWIAACRADPVDGWDGRVLVLDKQIASEEKSFVVKPTGKREHQAGCHDDKLFAAMVGWQLHLSCPRSFGGGVGVTIPKRGKEWVGGFDTWDPATAGAGKGDETG